MTEKNYDFVAYIDEAGETGLKNIVTQSNNGSSEWLILAASIISAQREKEVVSWRNEIIDQCTSRQSRFFHYRKAKLNQQIQAATRASSYSCRHFVVCSNKRNIEGYRNPFAASRNTDLNQQFPTKSGWLYYWLLRLLLERVTDFVSNRSLLEHGSPRTVRLEFSKNGGIRYDELKSYLELLRKQSLSGGHFIDVGKINWAVLDLNEIGVYEHNSRAGLVLPDIIASSFYQACDKHERRKPVEIKPALALRPRMAVRKNYKGEKTQREYGVKLMPNPRKIQIDDDQKQIFAHYGYNFK